MSEENKQGFITLNPTWAGLLGALLMVHENASQPKARNDARAELFRMAQLADRALSDDEIKDIQQLIVWAKQQGYVYGDKAIQGVARITKTEFKETQPYYGLSEFVPVKEGV